MVAEVTSSKGSGKRGDGDSPGPKHGCCLASQQALQDAGTQALDKPFHPFMGVETG